MGWVSNFISLLMLKSLVFTLARSQKIVRNLFVDELNFAKPVCFGFSKFFIEKFSSTFQRLFTGLLTRKELICQQARQMLWVGVRRDVVESRKVKQFPSPSPDEKEGNCQRLFDFYFVSLNGDGIDIDIIDFIRQLLHRSIELSRLRSRTFSANGNDDCYIIILGVIDSLFLE